MQAKRLANLDAINIKLNDKRFVSNNKGVWYGTEYLICLLFKVDHLLGESFRQADRYFTASCFLTSYNVVLFSSMA